MSQTRSQGSGSLLQGPYRRRWCGRERRRWSFRRHPAQRASGHLWQLSVVLGRRRGVHQTLGNRYGPITGGAGLCCKSLTGFGGATGSVGDGHPPVVPLSGGHVIYGSFLRFCKEERDQSGTGNSMWTDHRGAALGPCRPAPPLPARALPALDVRPGALFMVTPPSSRSAGVWSSFCGSETERGADQTLGTPLDQALSASAFTCDCRREAAM
jgi:hypothetical protein